MVILQIWLVVGGPKEISSSSHSCCLKWSEMSFSLPVHSGVHWSGPYTLHVFQFSHLAMRDHFHPLTTVIVWTPIGQETHRWRERERGGWFLFQAPSYLRAKYFLSGLMCSLWHVCGPHTSVNTSHVCVRLSVNQAACRSYTGIVRTRRGALFPLCLPGAAFHPQWAGRLGWLLVWHSADDLGREEGRHTAIHSHITHMGIRKAMLSDILRGKPPFLFDQKKKKCVDWAIEQK